MLNLLRCGTAVICLLAVVAPIHSAVADGLLPQSCASRDLAIFSLIEKLGEAQSRQPSMLGDAFTDVLDARRICREGHADEALAIYNRIGAQLIDDERWATSHSDP
ncbi:MAG: hypothetical protein ACRC9K_06630 [Afipia sp.]